MLQSEIGLPRERLNLGRTFTVDLIRHTFSNYNNYLRLEGLGADPNKYVDFKSQLPDINWKGKSLAKTSSLEYSKSIDPEKEIVVVISSKEMRAYQTAQQYITALKKRGIEIFAGIPSQQVEGAYPVGFDPNSITTKKNQKIDKRVIPHKAPSLGYTAIWQQDMLEPSIHSKKTTFKGLNEKALPPTDRKRFRAAREVIEKEGDLKAGWGDNFVKYEGQDDPFDIIPSAKSNREKMIKGLRLLRRLHRSEKTKEFEETTGKKIRYLVFTHEENLLDLIRSYFGEARVPNCACLTLKVPEESGQFITARYNDLDVRMSYLLLEDLRELDSSNRS